MQVTVESISGLERRMKVIVPAQRVEEQVAEKLREAAGKARINGFRPGKVPMREIKRRFGVGIRMEVSEEIVQETYFDAVQQESLQPAGMPSIENLLNEGGKDLEYDAVFEVYPEITLANLSEIEVETPSAQVTEDDVDNMIEMLRKQQIEYRVVERASAADDQLNVDFEGIVDGESFEGGSAQDTDLVLGSNTMIPGFEDGLVGASAGDEKTLNLEFPEDYHAKDLAAKAVQFKITVNSVSESVLPDLDEEFFKKYGVEEGGSEAFRVEIRSKMELDLENAIKTKVRNQSLDGLVKTNPVDIPRSLVDSEIERMRQDAVKQYGGPNADQIDPSILPSEMFADQAEQRVGVSLLVQEIIKENSIEVDKDRVRETITEMASSYDDSQQVIDWYYGNEQQLSQVENMVLQEQVVECILGSAVVTDAPMTYEEALAPPVPELPPEVSDEDPDVDASESGDKPEA